MTAVLVYAWISVGELTVLAVLLTEGCSDLRAVITSALCGTAGALTLGAATWSANLDSGPWGPAAVSIAASLLGAGAGLAVVLAWRRFVASQRSPGRHGDWRYGPWARATNRAHARRAHR